MATTHSTDAATLPAGRELDALVAERVMGDVLLYEARYEWPHTPGEPPAVCVIGMPTLLPECEARCARLNAERRTRVPDSASPDFAPSPVADDYSTDIAHAWRVVARMRGHPNAHYRNLQLVAWCYDRTYATFDAGAFNDYAPETWAEANGDECGYDDPTPLAICRAALLAFASAAG